MENCPACGSPHDYCLGHGPIGDPRGRAILELHDNDTHTLCHTNAGCKPVDRTAELGDRLWADLIAPLGLS